eukprot:9088557-Alexandrium_andersonii.AAC.2
MPWALKRHYAAAGPRLLAMSKCAAAEAPRAPAARAAVGMSGRSRGRPGRGRGPGGAGRRGGWGRFRHCHRSRRQRRRLAVVLHVLFDRVAVVLRLRARAVSFDLKCAAPAALRSMSG